MIERDVLTKIGHQLDQYSILSSQCEDLTQIEGRFVKFGLSYS